MEMEMEERRAATMRARPAGQAQAARRAPVERTWLAGQAQAARRAPDARERPA